MPITVAPGATTAGIDFVVDKGGRFKVAVSRADPPSVLEDARITVLTKAGRHVATGYTAGEMFTAWRFPVGL